MSRVSLLIRILALVLLAALPAAARCPDSVDMDRVEQLAELPVSDILLGAPIQPVADGDYRELVLQDQRPCLVFFYLERDRDSRLAATLLLHLAEAFHDCVDFFAFRAGGEGPLPREIKAELQRRYHLDQVPGALLYDPRRQGASFEHEGMLPQPVGAEYRTPPLLFWKTALKMSCRAMEKELLTR
ncbi:MAG TPA: hypothetical protein DD766_08640 [Desulfovibrio sp.]|nr:hypothetical protein [Desulfovibrio sp.]